VLSLADLGLALKLKGMMYFLICNLQWATERRKGNERVGRREKE